MNLRGNHWIPPVVWALVVLLLCGIPGQHIPEMSFWRWLRWDKLTHLVLFGTLGFLVLRASRISAGKRLGEFTVWTWVSLTILYGAIIEILQLTVFIDRSGDVRDAVANGLGAVLGLAVFRYRYRQDYQS
ncbi:MAG: putative integral rane protein [Bacteroidota bacterium]|jgi:VanZ family protein